MSYVGFCLFVCFVWVYFCKICKMLCLDCKNLGPQNLDSLLYMQGACNRIQA